MPPNMITAALDTARRSVSVADVGGEVRAERRAELGHGPRAVGGRSVARRPSPATDATMSRYQPSNRPTHRVDRCRRDRATRRPPPPPAARRAPRADRRRAGARVDEPLGLGAHERPEPLVDLTRPERRHVRLAVARVLGAVARQHARTDDPRRREARVVDGERVRVAQHLDGRRPTRHEVPAERGDPGRPSASQQPLACDRGDLAVGALQVVAPTVDPVQRRRRRRWCPSNVRARRARRTGRGCRG